MTIGPSEESCDSQPQPAATRPADDRRRNRRRRLMKIGSIGAAAVGASLLLVTLIVHDDPLEHLPTIDLSEMDSNVAGSIARARDAVVTRPRSDRAWGHLAMVLAAHQFSIQAETCL